jgi:hypothetical protein
MRVDETPADSQTSFSSISCSITEVDEDSIVVLPREHDTSTVSMGGSKSSERENAGDDPNSVVTTNVSVVPVKIRKPKSNAKSSIWNYFEVYTAKAFKDLAVCLICDAEVYYSDSMSTTMLQRHLRGKHRSAFDTLVEEDVKKKLKRESTSASLAIQQTSVKKFVTVCPSFEKAYLKWLIDTYQPISSCEYDSFREMCRNLNGKAPIIGREKVRLLLTREAASVRIAMKEILAGRFWCGTTDC